MVQAFISPPIRELIFPYDTVPFISPPIMMLIFLFDTVSFISPPIKKLIFLYDAVSFFPPIRELIFLLKYCLIFFYQSGRPFFLLVQRHLFFHTNAVISFHVFHQSGCCFLIAYFPPIRELFFRVVQYEIKDILLGGKDKGLTKMIKSAVVEGFHSALLHTLDQVADECNDAGIAARAMANIADVLGCMAGSRGGLRSGPAANKAWAEAFQMLEVR